MLNDVRTGSLLAASVLQRYRYRDGGGVIESEWLGRMFLNVFIIFSGSNYWMSW